ncbi:DUF1801 domain-containing protein [Aliiglaciecola litoralis]|uniref:YdhG-like domain-containing protein n=1 Tax=Aliiglaciecola litoralis TaxID=582857 RepID=A0ABP3WZK7_9ALTE
MTQDPVVAYINKHPKWQLGLVLLRERLRLSELQETIKWGMPTYCFDGKNVIGIGAFKHHYGMWFFNGAAMQDPKALLINAQQGKTKHMRHWRFQHVDDLDPGLIDQYIGYAIAAQRQVGSNQNP